MKKLFICTAITGVLLSCGPSRFVDPLKRGEQAFSGSLGGPIINVPGIASIPIPFTSLTYGKGLTDNTTLYGSWFSTAAIFGTFQFELGATHRLWKDELINMIGFNAASKAQPEYVPRHLDVAGGTGDIAFRVINDMNVNYSNLINKISEDSINNDINDINRQVVVCDINPEMLSVGRDRAETKLDSKLLISKLFLSIL